MSAAWLWVRLDLRQRARSLLVLALLVPSPPRSCSPPWRDRGGAPAPSTACSTETKPATIAVLPNEPGFDWEAIEADRRRGGGRAVPRGGLRRRRPAAGGAGQLPLRRRGDALDRGARRPRGSARRSGARRRGRDHQGVRGHLREGRRRHRDDPPLLAGADRRRRLGRRRAWTSPRAPAIEAEIVGVVRSPWFSDYGDAAGGTARALGRALRPAPREPRRGTRSSCYINALVRLEGGGDAVARVPRAARRGERPHATSSSSTSPSDAQHVRDVARFEADALLAFAAAAGIAALFLVGQSIVRYVAGATAELEVLRAVGMRPRHVRSDGGRRTDARRRRRRRPSESACAFLALGPVPHRHRRAVRARHPDGGPTSPCCVGRLRRSSSALVVGGRARGLVAGRPLLRPGPSGRDRRGWPAIAGAAGCAGARGRRLPLRARARERARSRCPCSRRSSARSSA